MDLVFILLLWHKKLIFSGSFKKIMGLKGAEATAKENSEYDYSLQIHLHYAELSSLDIDIINMNMKRSAKFKTLNTVNLN